MGQRCDPPQHARVADEDVELAPPLVDRGAEAVDAWTVGQVKRHQRRGAVFRLDAVVQRLEGVDLAADGDDVTATAGQIEGDRLADAAGGTGDDGDPAVETAGVGEVAHAFSRKARWFCGRWAARSVRAVG